MHLKELQKRTHSWSVDKGFWKFEYNLDNFNLFLLITKLMLIVTELAEAAEAKRKGGVHDNFGEELADAVIRIADMAEREGIDLEAEIEKKHLVNMGRPYKHGKKF